MASRTFAKENNVRYYRTSWSTTLECRIPLSSVAIVIRNNTGVALVWNNANSIVVRGFFISATTGDNVVSSDAISATRDESNPTHVTITSASDATIEALVLT